MREIFSDLSFNNFIGSIPASFGGLQNFQILSLRNNYINGSIPDELIKNVESSNTTALLDLQFNSLFPDGGNISDLVKHSKAAIWLNGNKGYCDSMKSPVCSPHDLLDALDSRSDSDISGPCDKNTCVPNSELVSPLLLQGKCICAVAITIGFRLKSPLFSFFTTFIDMFQDYIAQAINLTEDQVYVYSYNWETGPRVSMVVKLYPQYNVSRIFSQSEADFFFNIFSSWKIVENTTVGPLEFIFFSYDARQPVNLLSFKVTGVKSFSYKELSDATNLFSDSMKVGQGSYGKVYRGMLSDGQIVAIKRAEVGSFQGTNEFGTEIEMLSRVHHRNLVALIGYCSDNGEQMLVYEYMANGTLRDNLTPGRLRRPLDFATRVRIALGAARGILYMHTEANPPIFHRDIKTTNILLDKDKNAKVADFGLSKLAPVAGIDGSEPGHVSTVVKGTPGYLDPEYFLTRKLTDKSDVYSFGVVLLELLTATCPIANGKNIVREVNHAYENGTVLHIVDPNMGAYPSEAFEPFLRLALDCCKEKTEARPSMAEVVRDLELIWKYVHESESVDFELCSKEYQAYKDSGSNKSKTRRLLTMSANCTNNSMEINSAEFHDRVDIVVPR